MKTIHMIDNYRILCEEAECIGNFEAYKSYTEKYPYFFQGVFQYLYCQPMENLRALIERVDFKSLLQVAEKNYELGIVECVQTCINEFIERFQIDFNFTFLLGLELSNIGGCATPCDTDEPMLYIGIDRPLDKEWVAYFIPHEVYHMLRHHVTQDSAPETVFSRTIEEGLASYAPLWAYNLAWNVTNVAKTLGISEKQADNLMKNTGALLDKLILDGAKHMSPEAMKEYFTAQSFEVEFPVIGYYIGLYLAHQSVEKGVNFERFVSMSRNEIIDMWFHND